MTSFRRTTLGLGIALLASVCLAGAGRDGAAQESAANADLDRRLREATRREVALRLLPYMFLTIYAPIAAVYLPPTLRAPASFVMHVVSFTALAVLFDYYSDRSRVTS